MKAGFQNSGFRVNDLMKYTLKNKQPTSYLVGSLSHFSLQAFFFFDLLLQLQELENSKESWTDELM